MTRIRVAVAVVFLGAAMVGVAPGLARADVGELPDARYDDPTNTFYVIDHCGDGVGSELHVQIGGRRTVRPLSECERAIMRINAPEDAPLSWRVCVSRLCSPWRHEDV